MMLVYVAAAGVFVGAVLTGLAASLLVRHRNRQQGVTIAFPVATVYDPAFEARAEALGDFRERLAGNDPDRHILLARLEDTFRRGRYT